jgi:hypothetical protein
MQNGRLTRPNRINYKQTKSLTRIYLMVLLAMMAISQALLEPEIPTTKLRLSYLLLSP